MNDDSRIFAKEKDNSTLTRLKHENTELKKELHRLSMLVESSNAGYWDWDIQTGNIAISGAWAGMTGYTPEEIAPVTLATWKSFCHADDLREATVRLESHLRDETDYYEAEVRMRHKKGHWVWILDRGKVFERDHEGKALRMVGSHQEITERKHAEETIRQERTLFLEGPVTVFRWLVAEGYPTEYVSPNVTRLTGYQPIDFTSGIIAFTDVIHPDDLERILDEMVHYSSDSQRSSFEQEYRIIRKDGKIAWIYEFTTIIRDENGLITCYETYLLDNTIRKQSEASLAYNRQFEHLLSALANQFINASSERIDAIIDKALQAIGELVKADRSYIFQYRDNLRFMTNTHEWCTEGIEPQIDFLQKLSTDEFPWLTGKMISNELLIVPSVCGMPDEAASEKVILEQQDIKSLILIPLFSGSVPFGYIGFDAVRQERQWTSDSASILALAGGFITNALQRIQTEQLTRKELELALKLSASQSFAETLHHCLQTAMEISEMDCGGIYLLNENDASLDLAHSQGVSESFVQQVMTFKQDYPDYRLMTSDTVLYSDQMPMISESLSKVLLEESMKAFAMVPVISKNRVIALLNVASHTIDQVPEFSRKALETVASHIGAAIMQARHEERVSSVNLNLETLFNSIDDMLFVIGGNLAIVHANAASIDALGYSLDELRQMNLRDLHPPEFQEKALETAKQRNASTRSVCQMPMLMKSGKTIPVETKITPGIWDEKPVHFEITRNISERLNSQSALIESERKFRELTEYLPLPLFETDLRGIVNYINLSGMEFFDLTPEDIERGVSTFSFCLPENIELAVANQQKILDPGYIPKGNEYTIVMKDGRRLPLLLYSTPIRKEGKFAGVRTTVVDLSELKRAETALRENALQKRVSEEFRSIIDNIPGLVYHLSSDNTIRFLSETSQAWLTEALLPDGSGSLDKVLSLIHPEDRQAVVTNGKKIRRKQTSMVSVFRLSIPDKGMRWIENRSTSTFSDNGHYLGVDGILFDITDRVTAQEEKRQLEANLNKTQRLETIGTLAGGIAHDFNNILSPILGYAEMGVTQLPESNPLREYFTQIMLAAERAQHLVSQILTFSRAEGYKPVAVSTQSVIDEALKLLRPAIPATISINIIKSDCGNVLADPSQLHQVIVNLCTNAFQAMATSGGEMTIDLREVEPDSEFRKMHPTLKEERYVQISVTDTGRGMDEATMERIFEPFFTTKPVNKGTGLGLSVVHGIVSSFHGTIVVESTPGKGSAFRVYLPVISDDLQHQHNENTKTENQQGKRVLFVDDELAAIEVMRVMMSHLGFKIHALNSPVEALAELRKDPEAFDLVITDLTMPEMTGIELARTLHELNPQLPMILMTGYGKEIESIASLNRFGIRKLVKKPVRLSLLALAVREVLGDGTHP
ncbi:MAG: PAS domain-containing protein [Chlorobiaceae bacterium]|nr:PAS domain-containing protein [Chlorobiaceae bacterium]